MKPKTLGEYIDAAVMHLEQAHNAVLEADGAQVLQWTRHTDLASVAVEVAKLRAKLVALAAELGHTVPPVTYKHKERAEDGQGNRD